VGWGGVGARAAPHASHLALAPLHGSVPPSNPTPCPLHASGAAVGLRRGAGAAEHDGLLPVRGRAGPHSGGPHLRHGPPAVLLRWVLGTAPPPLPCPLSHPHRAGCWGDAVFPSLTHASNAQHPAHLLCTHNCRGGGGGVSAGVAVAVDAAGFTLNVDATAYPPPGTPDKAYLLQAQVRRAPPLATTIHQMSMTPPSIKCP
jgi:hypothetical protein